MSAAYIQVHFMEANDQTAEEHLSKQDKPGAYLRVCKYACAYNLTLQLSDFQLQQNLS